MKLRSPTFYETVLIIVVLAGLCVAAGVALTGTPVQIGTQEVPFTGLILASNVTNLPTGAATVCNNFVFDRQSSIHVRNGLDQWNENTRETEFGFFTDYTDPGGSRQYVAGNPDTMWVSPAGEPDWTGHEFVGSVINTGTVDAYTGEDLVHADGIYKWSKVAGNGDGLIISVDGTDYTIESVFCDSLLRVTTNFAGDETNAGYAIQLGHASVRDYVESDGFLFLATDNGMFKWDGDELTALSDSLSYYSYDYDSVTYRQYAGNAYQPEIRFWLGDWTGTGDEPAFADGTPEGLWPLGKYVFISSGSIAMDSSSIKDDIKTNPYTFLYGPINGIHSTPYLEAPYDFVRTDVAGEIVIFEGAFDEDHTITFSADSIVRDSISISDGTYSYYVEVWPADSVWDETRFETGDWMIQFDGYGGFRSIVGRIDTTGAGGKNAFYAVGPAIYVAPSAPIDCTVKRMEKSFSSGPSNYKLLATYKDRLWTVREDDPDVLRYSVKFAPEGLGNYELLALDISNGDEIEYLSSFYGGFYIVTRNTMHLLVGDPSQESSELIRLFSGVGVSAPNAVIEFEGNIFLPHHTGFYLFDGSTPNLISHKIQTFVTDSIDWVLAYDEMCAEYYADHIWISCPVVNSGGTRSFVYHLDTDKWGNMSFAASAYHRTLSPSDTNKFFICLKDSGSACVYKGYDDGGDGIYAEYRTGWDLFGTQAVKELTGYYITYDKSATCTLTVDIAPRDTIVWADSSSKWSSINSSLTQSYHDVRRNVTGGKAHGRYLQLGLNMYSSAGEGWISRITLELAEKEEKAYDR